MPQGVQVNVILYSGWPGRGWALEEEPRSVSGFGAFVVDTWDEESWDSGGEDEIGDSGEAVVLFKRRLDVDSV